MWKQAPIENCFRLPASAKAPVRAQKRADEALTVAGGHGYPGTHRVAVAGRCGRESPKNRFQERTVPGSQIDASSGIFIRGHSSQKRASMRSRSRGRAASDSSGPTFRYGGPSGILIRWSGMVKRRVSVKRREVRATFGV